MYNRLSAKKKVRISRHPCCFGILLFLSLVVISLDVNVLFPSSCIYINNLLAYESNPASSSISFDFVTAGGIFYLSLDVNVLFPSPSCIYIYK